ncbi:MAG: hypothetical protein QM831_43150 [Kofleriaceae bacterium]
MRFLWLVLIAACGSDDNSRHIVDGNVTGCTTSDCQAVAASFAGLSWELPCGNKIDAYDCSSPPTVTNTGTISGGTAGTTYNVTLHFQGVVEQRTYTGGTQDNYWYVGGTVDRSDTYNVYSLAVSDPAQTYYLNAGMSHIGQTWAIDYSETIPVKTGATLTLTADSIESVEILNVGPDDATPVTAPGATLVTQPYNGQFIQMDATSIATE